MKIFSYLQTIAASALVLGLTTTSFAASVDLTDWKKQVVKQVSKKQKYPRSAQIREIEGHAVVRLTVSATGAIESHEIVKSTGQSVLDREIPKLVSRLELPALPEGAETTTLRIPLDWRLN
jgi:protein TonB